MLPNTSADGGTALEHRRRYFFVQEEDGIRDYKVTGVQTCALPISDQPLVMENIPGFFDVKASQLPEPVWLRRFFDQTGAGFLLDLPHVWLEAHYRGVKPATWLAEFPLEQVVELHVAGVEEDRDLEGPGIAPAEPTDEMLDFPAPAGRPGPAPPARDPD